MRIRAFMASMAMVVGAVPCMAAGRDDAAKPQAREPKASAPAEGPSAAESRAAAAGKLEKARLPKSLKTFIGEFRDLDLDKKTVSFETDDGKSYTVEAQIPGMQDAQARAAQLAEVLQPGDRIRMLCRVDANEQPTLIVSLHMMGKNAPMQFR